MYVVPGARRTGVARAVLREVEAEGRRRGYRELRLETGVKQPEAIALYQSSGFELIPCWDTYADSAAEPVLREAAAMTSKTALARQVRAFDADTRPPPSQRTRANNRPLSSGYSRENGGVPVTRSAGWGDLPLDLDRHRQLLAAGLDRH